MLQQQCCLHTDIIACITVMELKTSCNIAVCKLWWVGRVKTPLTSTLAHGDHPVPVLVFQAEWVSRQFQLPQLGPLTQDMTQFLCRE